MIYEDVRAAIKGSEGEIAGNISIEEGVKQGCPLSPILFSYFIDRVEKVLNAQMNAAGRSMQREWVTLGSIRLALLLFADDMVLMGHTRRAVQLQLDGLSEFCRANAMTVSTSKTKAMYIGK
jgi:Reverse transcriptase (RNA-dependent DNA polymerase)